MEERQARWHYKSLVDGGGGAVHREWGWRRGESLRDHEVGRVSAMVRSLCELEWGKGERRGRGSLDQEACERWCLREKKIGGSGTGTRTKIEGRHGCREQRGVLCDKRRRVRHNAVATRERHMWAPPQMASAGHAVTATRRM
jgi:hypothetical protein